MKSRFSPTVTDAIGDDGSNAQREKKKKAHLLMRTKLKSHLAISETKLRNAKITAFHGFAGITFPLKR
ncbi:hypothetical protein T06_11120 [Trichinella sp. T6]|nr:hypothetical protein T06_11120 [Trichinella sp. T6]